MNAPARRRRSQQPFGVSTKADFPSVEDVGKAMLASLASVLEAKSAVYVSAPITTGPRLVDFLIHHSSVEHCDEDQFRNRVLIPNLKAAARIVRHVRKATNDLVIDPTAVHDIPGWEQHTYHSYWKEVVHSFAHTVVFVDGWECSTGCAIEFQEAVQNNLQLRDQRLMPLPDAESARLLLRGRDQLALAGLSTSAADAAYELLQSRGPHRRR